MEVRWVFFDAAGTLFSLRKPVGEIYRSYAVTLGFRPGETPHTGEKITRAFQRAFRSHVPLSLGGRPPGTIQEMEKEWWRHVVQQTFESVGPFPRFEEFFVKIYEVFRGSEVWHLEPGCRKLLVELKRVGKKLGIISNFDSRLWDVLHELQISGFFDSVVISSHAPAAKPNPVMFQHALKQAGTTGNVSIHIGDDLREDFFGARTAGMKAVLYDRWKRFSNCSQLRIERLEEVSAWLS